MADEKKRPWWAFTRTHGIFVTIAGVAMLFSPVTAPYAGQVIAAGIGMTAGGVDAASTRKIYEDKK